MPEALPPSQPEPQNILPAAGASITELEATADRYHRIMRITGITGLATAGYAALGEFVSEVTGDAYTNGPLAECSYFGAGVIGVIALAAAAGARCSRNGYYAEASELQALDE